MPVHHALNYKNYKHAVDEKKREKFIEGFNELMERNMEFGSMSWDIETQDNQITPISSWYGIGQLTPEKLYLPEAVMNKKAIVANKFYIGSPSVLTNNWGHATLEEAIANATERIGKNQGNRSFFIVQIVKVVSAKKPEVDVEDVE